MLQIACKQGTPSSFVRFLLEKGGDPNAGGNMRGLSPHEFTD